MNSFVHLAVLGKPEPLSLSLIGIIHGKRSGIFIRWRIHRKRLARSENARSQLASVLRYGISPTRIPLNCLNP
jgi:hypothetical protein